MLSQVYWVFIFVAFPLITLFVTAAMFTVYRTVHNQESRTNRYRVSAANHYQESKRIRKTMLLYTSSFYICLVIPLLFRWAHPTPQPYPMLNLLSEMILPLQGFFDMCVFIQPKCLKYQKDHPGTGLLTSYIHVLFNVDGCCKIARRFGSRFSASGTGDLEIELEDDGIGFSTYNEDDSSSLRRRSTLLGQSSPNNYVGNIEEKKIDEEDDKLEATESAGASLRISNANNCDADTEESQPPGEDDKI